MVVMKVRMTKAEAESYHPRLAKIGSTPDFKGKHIGYNSGMYGWNWDLIEYRGRYYVAGYRSFPKTFGEYKG